MYAETGLLFPYFQNTPQDFQQLEEFCRHQKSYASMNNIVEASMISEYDFGGEWDLFKAPEPIIEEPVIGLDPMSAASMMSCGEDVISSQGLKVADIESLQSEQLLDDVFYDKDILEKDPIETPLSEVLDIKIPDLRIDGNQIQENKPLRDIQFQKSVSAGCLSSMEWMHGASTKPNFMDISGLDLGAAYGIRRAFSEGDIKDGAGSLILSFYDRLLVAVTSASSILLLRGRLSSPTAQLRNAGKSFQDTGTRRQRGTLAGKSSMHAGRLSQTTSRGSVEGLQRLKNLLCQEAITVDLL